MERSVRSSSAVSAARFGQVGHLRDPLEFGGQAEIRQRGEDFRLVGGEGLQQVAEDVFERVVAFGGFVNEGAGFGDGAALRAFAPQLPRDPADEERVALRDLVQVFALFLGGAGEARIFGGEFGDELQGFVAGEAVEAHDARVHVGAAAGGDDGFVPFGQAREELEQARAFFFWQGFQIVEDDQRLFARQREAQFVGTLIGREFFESVCAQFLAQFVQHGEVGRAGEVGQFGFAFGGQFAHFGGDEDFALEEFRGASCAALMASAVLPMPPGPSINAPHVRDSGERAERIISRSLSRPTKNS